MPAAEAGRPISLEASRELFETLTFHAHVALAVSGGGDSTALMWLIARWARSVAHSPKISVLTVNHGLRPEAAVECSHVAKWAAGLGLDAHVLTASAGRPMSGIQEKARAMRYALLRDWCRANQASLLVTAHTLEDQAETFLMRLARGSGIRGLAGIRQNEEGNVLVERPLLSTRRADLRATLAAQGHPWIEDPSNEDERFERVRLRKQLPVLEGIGLSAKAVARSAARLERALSALDQMCAGFLADKVEFKPEGFAVIDRASYQKLDEEISIGVLERLLTRLGGVSASPRLLALEALEAWLRRGESHTCTLAGCRIAQRKRHILIGREAGRINRAPVVLAGGQSVLWDNRFTVSIGLVERICEVVPLIGLKVARNPDIPGFVQDGLPAILVGGEVAAIPSLGVLRPGAPPGLQATAEFRKTGL